MALVAADTLDAMKGAVQKSSSNKEKAKSDEKTLYKKKKVKKTVPKGPKGPQVSYMRREEN